MLCRIRKNVLQTELGGMVMDLGLDMGMISSVCNAKKELQS